MSGLQGHELVAHVVVAADDGLDPAGDHRWVRELWRHTRAAFAIDDPEPGYPAEPEPLPGPETAHAVLAVRTRRRGGDFQLVLRRRHDLLCLSLVLAPDAPGARWADLDRAWTATTAGVGPPPRRVLGSARVLQARLASTRAALDPPALDAALLADKGFGPDAVGTGVLVAAEPLGPFAVWEPGSGGGLEAWDARPDRRLVVVAAAGAEGGLSSWTWSRGTGEMPPLAGYLVAAARLRYELRVWRRAGPSASELRREAEDLVARDAEEEALHDMETRLVDRRTRLEDMSRSVSAAEWNMARHLPDRSAGPFADDQALGAWFVAQLASEVGDLDAARDRVHSPRRAPRARPDRRPGLIRDRHPQLAGLGERPRELQRVVNLAAGFQDVAPLATGLRREAARVCRVEVIRSAGTTRGTGVLVGPDLMLTSHHVLGDVVDGATPPGRVRCTFDHHVRGDGTVDDGTRCGVVTGQWLVAARPPSPVDQQPDPHLEPGPDELDYALVRLDVDRGHDRLPDGSPRGWLDLDAVGPVPEPGTPLLILQHPAGEPVKLAMDTAGVLTVNASATRVTYGVNTLPGSSGSPCFTVDLVPVAVHHAGSDGLAAGRNEGVPLAPVVADLRRRGTVLPGSPADLGGARS